MESTKEKNQVLLSEALFSGNETGPVKVVAVFFATKSTKRHKKEDSINSTSLCQIKSATDKTRI